MDEHYPAGTATAEADVVAAEARVARQIDERDTRKAALGALAGTALEWYDYFLFGTASALVFNVQYFVSDNPVTATLASFATFAVGFVARPIGGALFGAMGDKIGRRITLMITIVGIGVVTGIIGVLPTYASIGIAAPIALVVLRLLQGLCVGGEWSGAMTLVVEHAPLEKRARYAAIPQVGSPIGTLLSSGGFFLVSALMSAESFDSFGWRIPFLAAIPLLLLSIWIRTKLEESPVFREIEQEQSQSESAPLREVFTRHWRQFLAGTAVSLLGIGGFFLVTTFVVNYGVSTLGLSSNLMLFGNLAAATVEIFILLAAGRAGGRYGASKVATVGGLLSAVIAFPAFLVIDTGNPVLVVLGMAVAVACLSIPYGAAGPILTGMFPARARYSGVALSSNAAAMLGGFIPLLATATTAAAGGHYWPAAALLIATSLITALGAAAAPRLSIPVGNGFKH